MSDPDVLDVLDDPVGEIQGPIPPAPTESFVDMLKRWEEEWEAVARFEEQRQRKLKGKW